MTDRYAQPTPAELDEMYDDSRPEEVMGHCAHFRACMRQRAMAEPYPLPRDGAALASMLGCMDCFLDGE